MLDHRGRASQRDELLHGDTSAMEQAGCWGQMCPLPCNPTLLFITPKQGLSQEQRIFPFAYGQPQILCLGVLGGQVQLSEQQLAQRDAASMFICRQRKTNHDFQQHRSNNIPVTAN